MTPRPPLDLAQIHKIVAALATQPPAVLLLTLTPDGWAVLDVIPVRPDDARADTRSEGRDAVL